MRLISVVTPCYNEEANVEELYGRVKAVFASMQGYSYEHIFIDNASQDNTVGVLKSLAAADRNVKIIVNARNFGHIRSPYHALLQAKGDAVILVVSDLQDPPELIGEFMKKWEEGSKIVIGVKDKSDENRLMFAVRELYYRILRSVSEMPVIENFTGFGLYDRSFIEVLRGLGETYPYFRGIISELGYAISTVKYTQPAREKGVTKNNFYTLYDMAMLGFVSYSKIPLRMATFTGFVIASLSLLVALAYLVYKLLFWNMFQVGSAPVTIGLFFFSAVQLIFIGIIGEYIGAMFTEMKKRPLVIEKERINF
jgi:polyisoprenyl-phosphate glycosyltransferase